MVKLSNRLSAVASFVTDGNVLADVGTDHGYIPIYLLQEKRIKKAIAMDINAGPLQRAKEHIALYGLKDYIETRLSDGVEALMPGEADTILIAGMGGGLVMHILEDGRARTLEEVGKEFNVTRECIRQIEAKALRKLRHPSRSRKLKDYLE